MNTKFAAAIVASAALFLLPALSGCQATGGPDMSPVGKGLAVIGLGIVLAAFIRVLAKPLSRLKPSKRKESDEEPQ